eukprot:gene49553-28303_t
MELAAARDDAGRRDAELRKAKEELGNAKEELGRASSELAEGRREAVAELTWRTDVAELEARAHDTARRCSAELEAKGAELEGLAAEAAALRRQLSQLTGLIEEQGELAAALRDAREEADSAIGATRRLDAPFGELAAQQQHAARAAAELERKVDAHAADAARLAAELAA